MKSSFISGILRRFSFDSAFSLCALSRELATPLNDWMLLLVFPVFIVLFWKKAGFERYYLYFRWKRYLGLLQKPTLYCLIAPDVRRLLRRLTDRLAEVWQTYLVQCHTSHHTGIKHQPFVEIPRFELGLTEPKSVVLPLHHTSMLQIY